MKKIIVIILSFFAAIALAFIIGYIFIATVLGSILTTSFGAKTTVGNAALTHSYLKLWDVNVENPPKAKHPHALTIGKLSVVAPITTYLRKDIKIEKITLDNLILDVEVIPGAEGLTNWDAIVNHITSPQKPTDSTSDTTTTIDTLLINNITVNYLDAAGNVNTTTIKNLTFKNLSTKNGDITSQIAKTILLKILLDVKNVSKIPLKITNESVNTFFKQMNIPIKING
jgi:uncharacterized protein involved in outer membrane biogenesis